jgi:glycine/D-amino acid oxidase-like deaminating enzyme/nitrite reductase/ring-hydroxylating ferredoxin subunit
MIGGPIATGQGVSAKSSVATQPYWIDSVPLPRFPKLDRDDEVDVVVVGGGITGLTAAYLLTLDGRRVALLERGRCAQIDTGHTTAHLTMVTDERLSDLVKRFGRDHAQAAWEAGLAAIGQIDAIVGDLEIACDFEWVPGYMHAPFAPPADDDQSDALREEAMLAAELGFDATFVEQAPLGRAPAIRFDGQARFHPRKYLAALARAIADRGGMIFEHSASDGFCDDPRSVTSNGCTLGCGDIVLATHTPLMGNTGLLSATLFQTKLSLYTSYAVSGRVEKGRIADALFWDTADPYHYLRLEPHRDHDEVIFGGEDHKTGQTADTAACFERLERTLRSIAGKVEIAHRWSGQVIETADGLPYIGETAPHQFAGTGYSGNGMTFGTLAGMMAADRIMGRKNPWSALFDPSRKTLGGLWDYVTENADYPYYLARDRFAGSDGKSLRSVPRGSGKVLDLDGQAVAVYRDARGVVTKKSATCPHMGCHVEWNGAERTWDCPCHGSRFRTDGAVIAGPAESPLSDPDE